MFIVFAVQLFLIGLAVLLSLLLTASLKYWIYSCGSSYLDRISKLISVDSCVLHQYWRQPLVIVVRSYVIVKFVLSLDYVSAKSMKIKRGVKIQKIVKNVKRRYRGKETAKQ